MLENGFNHFLSVCLNIAMTARKKSETRSLAHKPVDVDRRVYTRKQKLVRLSVRHQMKCKQNLKV